MKSKRQKNSEISLLNKKENHCPIPKGTLLLIGGKENKGENQPENKKKPGGFIKLEVLKGFRDLISKKDPYIEVITTSSSEGTESFATYKKVFSEIGIKKIGHIHHNLRKEILSNNLAERIKRADGLFFTGGDQLKLTSIYGGSDFLYQVKEKYIFESVVIAGTSAGAMAMSTPMIYAGSDEVQELGGEIKVTTGMEFLKDVCIDTHFVHRGRFVRMAQVVVTNPSCIGIGIEEDSAIIIRNGKDVEVMGTGLVIIMEGFKIEEANMDDFTNDKPVTIRDLRMHLLSSGNKYEIPQKNPQHK